MLMKETERRHRLDPEEYPLHPYDEDSEGGIASGNDGSGWTVI
jgi:hypothetical protein